MKLRGLMLCGLLLLGGCASLGTEPRWFGEVQWRTGVERAGFDPDRVLYPFGVTPEMRSWARRETAWAHADLDELTALQRALFNVHEFTFEYDEAHTLPPSEAFAERRGNCLTFTALFVALSRSLGLNTVLVSVKRAPRFTKGEDLVIVNRHVVAGYPSAGRIFLFDFYRTPEEPYYGYQVVDDVTGTALFYANFGGAALQAGDLQAALSNLEMALRLSPSLGAAWVNLGVVLRRAGDRENAVRAYQRALKIEPDDPSAWTNLAYVYQLGGEEEKARLALLAAARGGSSPYSLIALAEAEVTRGRLGEARRYLDRARRRFQQVPEVWDALSRFAERQGRPRRAAKFARHASRLRQKGRDRD